MPDFDSWLHASYEEAARTGNPMPFSVLIENILYTAEVRVTKSPDGSYDCYWPLTPMKRTRVPFPSFNPNRLPA